MLGTSAIMSHLVWSKGEDAASAFKLISVPYDRVRFPDGLSRTD